MSECRHDPPKSLHRPPTAPPWRRWTQVTAKEVVRGFAYGLGLAIASAFALYVQSR